MADVEYRVVRHDGGWAYREGDTLSAPVPTREQALVAAVIAAEEMSGEGVVARVLIEDAEGRWVEVPEAVTAVVRKALEAGVPTNPAP